MSVPRRSSLVASVTPAAPPDVVAAVVVAYDALRRRRVTPMTASRPGASVWRFSGRWWARPSTARRDRPWAQR